ncbi:MAG: hypothetical protein GOMPHAMPRED_006150 [Gomphillus americanus]|uniref:Uncharacterized protein n=1 Tax=Gomphillus americanus TaxID=1940652 RepID=A0A8H3HZ12_9LECA|nr:MAG: hypothetical protein GOMPHAMPRED_006150 [Gomphillus americanus]
MADALSIEEANKVRARVGLPLLPVPGKTGALATTSDTDSSNSEEEEIGSTLESRQAEGYGNWDQLQKQAAEKEKKQARLNAIKKSRDEAQRKSKLKGKGLGEADEDEDLSAKAWLKGSAKRRENIEKEREKARKIQQEQREREEREYTSKDLAGLKVAHQATEFDLGDGEQILTLKDATIEENEEEGDELENVQLAEKERLEERLSLKRKKPGYNPMDDVDGEKKVLQQYDEVIDGKKRKAFTLNGEGEVDQADDLMNGDASGKTKTAISLDILKELPSSDYQEPAEVKMKKIKKKKVKNVRQRELDEDDIAPIPNGSANDDLMDLSSMSRPAKRQKNDSFDDEDLQLSLARQRRAALKQRKRTRPEDLAEQIRQEESEAPDIKMEDADEAGLIIDETSEFISNLQLPEPDRPRVVSNQTVTKKEESDSDDEDTDMAGSYNNVPDPDTKKEETESTELVDDTGLGQEATVNSGIAAALNLARDRGLVANAREGESNEDTRRRNMFMNEMAKIERDVDDWAKRERERLRNSIEWKRLSIREQESRSGRLNDERDRRKSDLRSQLMSKQYRPSVQLKYVDEHGRNMNQKEAFKNMSHAFHGKGSGKQKTERHLKKIEDEKQREAKSVLDSTVTGGSNSAASKKNKASRF